MKYILSIVSIFKNESQILQEWLEHYLSEGVEHFYLIDNGSTDHVQYKKIIEPYQKDKLVEIQIDQKPHQQEAHYNNYYLNRVKNESEWVMVIDMDEFIYSRKPYRTITDYLKTLPSIVSQIYVPWKLFGSSGHLKQPEQCVKGFTMRTQYQHIKTNGMIDPDRILVKTLIRTSYLTRMSIHYGLVNGGQEITSDGQPIQIGCGPKNFQKINETILEKSFLHCNHYPIQSLEWYRQIKMTRGSASSSQNDQIRTIDYYNSFESHSSQMIDDELSEKHWTGNGTLHVYYGAGTYYEVTRYLFRHFLNPSLHTIIIESDVNFNACFGDPVEHTVKYLVVRNSQQLKVYPETNHGKIVIEIPK